MGLCVCGLAMQTKRGFSQQTIGPSLGNPYSKDYSTFRVVHEVPQRRWWLRWSWRKNGGGGDGGGVMDTMRPVVLISHRNQSR